MSGIDEKAFAKIMQGNSDISTALWRNAIEAYEAAKEPVSFARLSEIIADAVIARPDGGITIKSGTLKAGLTVAGVKHVD